MTSRNRFRGITSQLVWVALLLIAVAVALQAQTPTAFTYRGHLTDPVPPDGSYDLQFALYDLGTAGTQLAVAQTIAAVPVTNGGFTVRLDFGAQPFVSGQARYLEIAMRPAGQTGDLTTIVPRQEFAAAPYAIRSQSAATADSAPRADVATSADDATRLGGVAAGQYVRTDDPRLSVRANDYILNTTQPQSANFNITGDGTASGTLAGGVVSATTEYRIGGNRVLRTTSTNTSVGIGAGVASAPWSNSFFGYFAGANSSSVNAKLNSFFGESAGRSNISGAENAFFGYNAGYNSLGGYNSFFGSAAGFANTNGDDNSFMGHSAGAGNETGTGNSFFGSSAGYANQSGSSDTYLGKWTTGADALTNSTAVGANAYVAQSNSLVLGSIAGVNYGTADTNVGIGTTAPSDRLTVKTATNTYGIVHTDGSITVGTFVGGAGQGGYLGTRTNHPLHLFANNGAAALTIDTTSRVRIVNLGSGGSIPLCRNSSNQISSCSSSLRYKTNVAPFGLGLNLVRQLRPITFDWKDGGAHDLGLGAEEVARVEPLLATYNEKGEVEGVKYDRVAVVLVNAVGEQQAQLERQQREINQQRVAIRRLTTAVAAMTRTSHGKRRIHSPQGSR